MGGEHSKCEPGHLEEPEPEGSEDCCWYLWVGGEAGGRVRLPGGLGLGCAVEMWSLALCPLP